MIQELNEIDCEIYEGRLLMAALSIITTECRTNKTPLEVIDELDKLSIHMFRGEEYYNQIYNQKIPELLYKDGTSMKKVKLGKEAQELLDEATKRFNQPNL